MHPTSLRLHGDVAFVVVPEVIKLGVTAKLPPEVIKPHVPATVTPCQPITKRMGHVKAGWNDRPAMCVYSTPFAICALHRSKRLAKIPCARKLLEHEDALQGQIPEGPDPDTPKARFA